MATASDALRLRIITHNIRTIPLVRFPPEKSWDTRKRHLIHQLTTSTTQHPETLTCLQEVLHRQLEDILNGLNSSTTGQASSTASGNNNNGRWKHIGCGRDGNNRGEYSPILYRSDIWDVEWTETRWLCPDYYDRPSRGWDAAHRRILTAAVMRHRGSSRRLLALNTHLDHKGRQSRLESAKMALQWVEKWLSSPGPDAGALAGMGTIEGVFLCGDFNTDAQDQGDAYSTLTAEVAVFSDAKRLASDDSGHTACGDGYSFTGFNDNPKDDALLDYVLLGPKKNNPWDVWNYDILPNKTEEGVYISDHRAVVVDVQLKGQ